MCACTRCCAVDSMKSRMCVDVRCMRGFNLQAANRGKQATVAEWKTARQALQDARDALIADAGPKERERLLATLGGVCSGQGSRGAGDLEDAPSS